MAFLFAYSGDETGPARVPAPSGGPPPPTELQQLLHVASSHSASTLCVLQQMFVQK